MVALAYLDQLQRSGAVAPADVSGLRGALVAARSDIDASGAIRRWPRNSTDWRKAYEGSGERRCRDEQPRVRFAEDAIGN